MGKLHGSDACVSRIIEFLRSNNGATRTEIGAHMLQLYGGKYTEKQIYNKVSYALKRLDDSGTVIRDGPKNRPVYHLRNFDS